MKKLNEFPMGRKILAFNCKHLDIKKCKCTLDKAHSYAPGSEKWRIQPNFHNCLYIFHPSWKGICDYWEEKK